MTAVWIFLVLTQHNMIEVGKFVNEETCENTRKELLIQRTLLGYGTGSSKDSNGYILTKYFETTKCFQVWK